VFSGVTGQGAAAEAVRFHKIYKELPEMDRIIADPKKAKIPHDIETQHVIVAAMANRTTEKNFGKIIQYFDRWYVGNNFADDIPRAEMVLAYMKDAVNRHTELQATEEWVQWVTEHTEVYV